MRKYKEEIKEEFKNNSIVLSFALCIIVIGILSIFFKTGSTLLIGIAISGLLLTIIQCISEGNTLLNILPVFTLLIFGFFEKSIAKIPVINLLVDDNICYFIIFLSLAITFFTQSYKNIIYKYKVREQLVNYNKEKNSIVYNQLEVLKKISEMTYEARNKSSDKDAFKDLINYIDQEVFVSNVKNSLINTGNSNYNIDEVEESIKLNSKNK